MKYFKTFPTSFVVVLLFLTFVGVVGLYYQNEASKQELEELIKDTQCDYLLEITEYTEGEKFEWIDGPFKSESAAQRRKQELAVDDLEQFGIDSIKVNVTKDCYGK